MYRASTIVLGLAAIAAVALLAAPRPPKLPTGGGPYPSDWFAMQRAFPGQTVNQEAYLAAVEWARVEREALPATLAGPFWIEAGPFNIPGRVTALAVGPGHSTVYLGAAAGGVFKSTNSGVNWTPIFDQVASIGALTLDPTNPSVLYVGTGEANGAIDNYDGAGLFKTSDAGANWEFLGLQETRRIGRVAVDPANPSRIFVAAMGSQFTTGPHRGLYRSENGGQSWTKVLFVNDSTGVIDVVVNPQHPETVYCASWERIRRAHNRRVFGPGCGIWRSIDYGTTWTRLQNGLPAPSDDVGRIGLEIAPSKPWVVYAQIIGGPNQGLNGLGLYRTVDGGATWTRRDGSGFTGIFGGFGWYFGDLIVDPINPDRLFCMGVQLVRSQDGGVNFTNVTSEMHVDHHAAWIDPTNPLRMYVGNDGGFYSTNVGGPPWMPTADLPTNQFYAGTIDPSNPSRLLGGSQDNGTSMTFGAPNSWIPIFGGDGFYCIVDPTNPNIVFAEYQGGSGGQGPFRSVDGGSSFQAPIGVSNGSNRFNWNTPFVMDPNDHNVLLTGSQRVYKSTDNGLSYLQISGDLSDPTSSTGNLTYRTISTLEIAKANSSVYYAGTDDGKVHRSINAGGAWTDVTGNLPKRWVTRVSTDPSNANVVYVTLSGFSLDEYVAHVYRSTTGGVTWTAIDGNLPDVPANDLLVDPLDPNRLYLANDIGVYTTRDLGLNWYPIGLGMPIVPVVDLTLHGPAGTLVATTHGRSQWRLDLNQIAVGVPNAPAPARLALSRPSPNPSRGVVTLTLDLSRPGRARAEVYDALGRRVAGLLDRELAAGRHTLRWDGRDASGREVRAGTYLVRASSPGGGGVTQRLIRR